MFFHIPSSNPSESLLAVLCSLKKKKDTKTIQKQNQKTHKIFLEIKPKRTDIDSTQNVTMNIETKMKPKFNLKACLI